MKIENDPSPAKAIPVVEAIIHPSNAIYPYLVALINIQLMGTPTKESTHEFIFVKEGQIN